MEPIYTGPNHALGLARELMDDIGWSAAAPVCGNGVLQSGEQCDDGNTTDGDCCSAICTFEPADTPCNDGSVCTLDEKCNPTGACVGTPIDCNDGDLCTADSCNPQSGCVHTPDASPCSDGNLCTSDQCANNTCFNTALRDFTGAFCELDALNSAVCNPEPIDGKLQRTMDRRSAKARKKLEAAMRSTAPGKRARLIASAGRIIEGLRKKVERSATRGRITGSCQGMINGHTDQLAQIIGSIS
jgi:cysteine-rich repeat protein